MNTKGNKIIYLLSVGSWAITLGIIRAARKHIPLPRVPETAKQAPEKAPPERPPKHERPKVPHKALTVPVDTDVETLRYFYGSLSSIQRQALTITVRNTPEAAYVKLDEFLKANGCEYMSFFVEELNILACDKINDNIMTLDDVTVYVCEDYAADLQKIIEGA